MRTVGVMLVLGFLSSTKICAAEATPKKPASDHRPMSRSGKKAKEIRDTDSEPEAARTPRPEAAVMLDLFPSADVDRDGHVDRSELVSMVQEFVSKRVEQRFKQLDKNRDGRVERLEVSKMDPGRFIRFDRNGDGVFTVGELAQVMREQCTQRVDRIVASLDSNGDGRFTQNEIAPQLERDERLANRVTEKNPDARRADGR